MVKAASFEIHVSAIPGGRSLTSFEVAAERIAQLSRLDLEPDGFFVWAIDGQQGWRISGMMYDNGKRLQYVHVQGKTPWQPLNQLLLALEPDPSLLQITRLPSGGLQDFQTFRDALWPNFEQATSIPDNHGEC